MGAHVKLGKDVTPSAPAQSLGAGEHAIIGAHTRIEAGAVIGEGVIIGEDCRIYPRAVLYPGTTLGNRVRRHPRRRSPRCGRLRLRARLHHRRLHPIPPAGNPPSSKTTLEIGANSTVVDRGALRSRPASAAAQKSTTSSTSGHNCDIGEDVILVMGTGISGSSSVGKGAILAGQVGIGDHVTIGPGVILGGQSGVFNGKTVTNEGLKPGTVLFGTPARLLRQVLREQAVVARLAKPPRKAKDTE